MPKQAYTGAVAALLASAVAMAETPPASEQAAVAALFKGMAGFEFLNAPAMTEFAGEEIVVRLTLGKYLLSEGAVAYDSANGVLLPLSVLSQALDFAIVVTPEAGTAKGWYLDESRSVDLDVGRGDARIAGERRSWPPGSVQVLDDDIYVAAPVLAEWFPLKFDVDLGASEVRLTARERLPFEDLLDRQRNRDRGAGQRQTQNLPQIAPAYLPLSWPFLDVSVDASTGTDEAAANRTRGSVLLAGDLLYMGARGFVSADPQHGLDDARLRLERRDADGQALGPLGVTEFALGDLFTRQVALVSRGAQARGLSLSNAPLDLSSNFDTATIRGELPPGWDVELYRNGALLRSGIATADGRYEFVDVPLLAGQNELRILMFGPQGQRREDVQRVYTGPDLLKSGEANYRLFAGRHEEKLIDVDDQDAALTRDEAQGAERLEAEVEYGLGRSLSLAGGFLRIPAGREERRYGTLGLRGQLAGVLSRLDWARDLAGGDAVEGTLLSRLGPANVVLGHAQFVDDYLSESTLDSGPGLRSRSRLRVDGPIRLGERRSLTSGLQTSFDRFADGRTVLEADLRMAAFFNPLSVGHLLDYRGSRSGQAGSGNRLRGQLGLSGRLRRHGLLRGELSYSLRPDTTFDGFQMSWDRSLKSGMLIRASAAQQFGEDGDRSIGLGANRRWLSMTAGLHLNWAEQRGIELGLALFFGLARNPLHGDWLLRSEGMAAAGTVQPVAFLDHDADGRFGRNDVPLEGLRFSGTSDRWVTDARGTTTIPGFNPYLASTLSLDESSLTEPTWLSGTPGYKVVTRPGRATVAEFPVVATGEIEGTAYLRQGQTQEPASNVRLLLIDESSRVVAETRTGYDGFYLFERVRHGHFLVTVAPEQVDRLGLQIARVPDVTLSSTHDVIRGVDILISRGRSNQVPMQDRVQ